METARDIVVDICTRVVEGVGELDVELGVPDRLL
jgi:hypothetical protein